jgi:hypothetical protein
MTIPKVFISYSHDTLEHKKWVLELAIRLRTNGIDAILDQWELTAGSDIPHYMENNLATADYTIMVCTSNYVQKANQGTGGVGYEKMIITSSLMKSINETKIIPIVRQSGQKTVPTFLTSKMYIDFSNSDEFELAYDNLIRAIHKSPIFKKPEIGNNPFERINSKPAEPKHDPVKEIMKFFAKEYEAKNDALYFEDIQSALKVSRIMLEYLLTLIVKQGLIDLRQPYRKTDYYELTKKGISYIVENRLSK